MHQEKEEIMTITELDNNINYLTRLNKKLTKIAKTKELADKVDIHRIIKQSQQLTQQLRLHTYTIID